MRLRRVALPFAAHLACGGSPSPAVRARAADSPASSASASPPASAVARAGAPSLPSCDVCVSYGPARQVGSLPAPLDELSGLAASRTNPGILWAHNDSGDRPRVFALDETARLRAVVEVTNANAVDWEDIALGPCPSGSCVFVGDIGDNTHTRNDYVVYRIPEPKLGASGGAPGAAPQEMAATADAFPFVYPDGPHDAEALFVHPTRGDLYIVTKEWIGEGAAYRYPGPLTSATVTLERISSVRLPGFGTHPVTAMDVHPCADRVLLRTYDAVLEYRLSPGVGFERIFQSEPRIVARPSEKQGEAVAYRIDGRGFFTASEGPGAPLHAIGCR